MIEVGLCAEHNNPRKRTYPSESGPLEEISISNLTDISITLRNRPYNEIYETLRTNRDFNMLLIDGSMILLRYIFAKKTLLKHILSYYPPPTLSELQQETDIDDQNGLLSDIFSNSIVTVPMRFDYDPSTFKDYSHPNSHFSIGGYKNCRIPVAGALMPYNFINLILRAFYSPFYHEHCESWSRPVSNFTHNVTQSEKRDLHWSF